MHFLHAWRHDHRMTGKRLIDIHVHIPQVDPALARQRQQVGLGVGGEDDDLGPRPDLEDLLGGLDPVPFRQLHVDDEDVGLELLDHVVAELVQDDAGEEADADEEERGGLALPRDGISRDGQHD